MKFLRYQRSCFEKNEPLRKDETQLNCNINMSGQNVLEVKFYKDKVNQSLH